LNSHYYFAPYYVYYDLALLPVEKLWLHTIALLYCTISTDFYTVVLGGLVVSVDPRFAGSNPAADDGF
jgi:hypothetical protein